MISVPEHRDHRFMVILVFAGIGLVSAVFGLGVLAVQIFDWVSTGQWRSILLIDALFDSGLIEGSTVVKLNSLIKSIGWVGIRKLLFVILSVIAHSPLSTTLIVFGLLLSSICLALRGKTGGGGSRSPMN
jgi:hypothetical protein